MTLHRSVFPSLSLCTFLALLMHSIPCAAAMDGRATVEDDKLVYRDQGQTIVIEGWGNDSLRVRITPDGSKQTSDWALDARSAHNQSRLCILDRVGRRLDPRRPDGEAYERP